jgi:biotin transport system substrate-specific component
VNKEFSFHSAQVTATPAVWLRNAGIVLAGSAFAAVCAHVSLPLFFSPVPLTLQPFAVLLLGLLLTPRMAAATLGAYLIEGAAGLPVFAPSLLMTGGLAHLLGPTGGYLFAYPLAAALISYLWRRQVQKGGSGFATALLCAAAGDFAILSCGAVWLAILMHASAEPALRMGVLPFLPGDALKIASAATIVTGFARLRRPAV